MGLDRLIGLHPSEPRLRPAKANIAQFIEDMYNTKRLHFSPGHAPPNEFEV